MGSVWLCGWTLGSSPCLSSPQHVDFRRKSREAVALFAQHVAPKYGDLVLSVTHRPVDEDQISLIPSTAVRLEELRNWDRTYASALRSLSKINTIDLTIPTLEFHSMYGECACWLGSVKAEADRSFQRSTSS